MASAMLDSSIPDSTGGWDDGGCQDAVASAMFERLHDVSACDPALAVSAALFEESQLLGTLLPAVKGAFE